ncbi:MAG TPA: hypothetical protein VII69_10950 [Candidatus Eremiobacteraceae bacterium]
MLGRKTLTGRPWLDAVLGILLAALIFPVLLVAALLPLGMTEPEYGRGVAWGIGVPAPFAIWFFVSRRYRGMSLFGLIFWPALMVSWVAALVTGTIVGQNMRFGF